MAKEVKWAPAGNGSTLLGMKVVTASIKKVGDSLYVIGLKRGNIPPVYNEQVVYTSLEAAQQRAPLEVRKVLMDELVAIHSFIEEGILAQYEITIRKSKRS